MINTPTPDVELPANVKKQLTDAQNAVTIAQVELNRLQELRNSEMYSIDQLNKQRTELTIQVVELSYRVENETAMLNELLSQRDEAQEILTQARNNKVAVEALLSQKEKEVADSARAVQIENEALEILRNSVHISQQELKDSAEQVEAKKKILEETLNALK